ncbi:hypothetical protein HD596_007017 [Nonomuraea jabiensis]|uniref:Uncharacterized protein n=1 Tax=Nonomuraea jabiensis TaxID=882448 RepID=A0A7W9GAU5_9ACTN|nr:hypothetical protein [Nonomuraea jabiensis]
MADMLPEHTAIVRTFSALPNKWARLRDRLEGCAGVASPAEGSLSIK